MDTASPADDLNKRSFSVARKGYDRGEVDRFRSDAVRLAREAESEVAKMRETLEQLGLTEGVLVRDELAAIGAEVKTILEAAREAAENMRTRAADDAGRWRNEADAQARTTRTEATEASEMLRASAWDSANEMIAAAKEQAEALLTSAQEDALFLRAEAEREAVRLTGDARQDSDNLVREAKRDAEMLLTAARDESEQLLLDAHQAAESAQQRARALEERRAELMAELEMARQSIGEISSAAQAPQEESPPTPQPKFTRSPESGGWAHDDGTVRVIDVNRGAPIAASPVDALAMADEVAALRQTRRPGEVFDGGDVVDESVESDTTAEDAAGDQDPDVTADEPAPAPEPEKPVPAESVPTPTEAPDADNVEPGASDTEAATSEPEPEDTEESEPVSEGTPPEDSPLRDTAELDALFAALREAPAESAATPAVEPPVVDPEPESATPEPEPEPAPPEPTTPSEPEPVTEAEAEAEIPIVEEFEDERDRLLLPLENRSLRSVKRHIVEVQNQALEALRTSNQEWRPTRKDIDKALVAEIDQLVSEAYLAGYASEAQRRGVTASQPKKLAKGTVGKDFANDLVAAIDTAIEGAVASGAGARQVASAASKVFRAWRTDEAERKLRAAARSAYAAGIDVL
jgi:cell division septum initiation protein DivIVA